MDQLIRQYPYQVVTLVSMVVAGVLGGLYKLGWLRFGKRNGDWDGHERRHGEPCDQHSAMSGKVCALYSKIEDIDKKLDAVAEKLQFVLGSLEARWGAGKGR